MTTCRYMVRAFGKTMAVLPELGEGDPLPSPESLRGKIIIKGKVVREGEVSARISRRMELTVQSVDRYLGVSASVTADCRV